MNKYHFDCGNSTDGPVGFSGVVEAASKEDALKQLKEHLPTEGVGIHGEVRNEDGDRIFEYLNVYFNPDKITLGDISEEQ